jgi:hypothetical protein
MLAGEGEREGEGATTVLNGEDSDF